MAAGLQRQFLCPRGAKSGNESRYLLHKIAHNKMLKHSKGPGGHPSVPLKEAGWLGLHGLSVLAAVWLP